MTDTDPVLALLVPDHSHDPIVVVGIDRLDGGLSAVEAHLEGEAEEHDYPGRRDVIAFVREDANRSDLPLNLRASRILSGAHRRSIQGPCLIVGQEETDGIGRIVELPDDVTPQALIKAGSVPNLGEQAPAPHGIWNADA
jgi:hypothetical protein